MTRHDAFMTRLEFFVDDMQIGPAHPARQYAQEHVSRTRLRHLAIFER
jgi:hypothetical protein